ncbi:conserved hypothetical protein [Acinetobacter proteolyticus]|uniref:Uncharacterized protein n=1 Tax=Acinetobacter proteolyticus TaxID=1776741 RepID=A0A653K4H8_9GAMM|nr:hypothetical protein [Acinetobacter proteolyticus]VXA55471.1 conserved hypothetical protein [Acinetobacter proteolyticus]
MLDLNIQRIGNEILKWIAKESDQACLYFSDAPVVPTDALSDFIKTLLEQVPATSDKNDFVLMPAELSLEAATKRANEQYDECSDNFKNLHRDCGEPEYTRLKTRWIENRAFQLQEQYRALVKVVGRTS